MKEWELDRLYIWIRAASLNDSNKAIKYFIDLDDKILFNLIQHGKTWTCVLNNEISVSYTASDFDLLQRKINALNSHKNTILEFPKLSTNEIQLIESTKSELETKRMNNVSIDAWQYNEILYGRPIDFGVEWLKSLKLQVEELSIIGF